MRSQKRLSSEPVWLKKLFSAMSTLWQRAATRSCGCMVSGGTDMNGPEAHI